MNMYEVEIYGRKGTKDIIAENMMHLYGIAIYLGFGIRWRILSIQGLKQDKKSKVVWDDMIMPNINQLN